MSLDADGSELFDSAGFLSGGASAIAELPPRPLMPRICPTTGLNGLDCILGGIYPGDSLVWQVDNVSDYRDLVRPFARAAQHCDRRLIYFRFGSDEPLIPEEWAAEVHHLDPQLGFESFVTEVHRVMEGAGNRAAYIFDCLSELASIWSADQMLGNFFLLTCPRLHDLDSVAYLAIYRNYHASFALNPVMSTAQFVLDVFRHEGTLCMRPIKVQHRPSRSPDFTCATGAMYLWKGADQFQPVTNSAVVAEMLASSNWPGLRSDTQVGFWRRIFDEAQKTYDEARAGRCPPEKEREVFARLSRMVLSHDPAMLRLAHRYLDLGDILQIRDRMVGIGLIGGKALGMLLARAILKHQDPRLYDLLETHDSFYIGSDVFYTFLIRNGIWWRRQKQRDPDEFLHGLDEAQTLVMQGDFPDYTMSQFSAMLDYFGESPYIVRSSSLLEDTYGNAFAGKYDSVFCVNQGSREQRMQSLLDCVRKVYASAMSEKALRYRVSRGLLDRDEQMALLVMRVSGSQHKKKFFPQIAGVGFSFNPYVWHKDIDSHAGVVRLVFGLGTRAVDRADDDYTRIVALNAPHRRPESNFDEVSQYSQRRVDYLDLAGNSFRSGHFLDLLRDGIDTPLELIAAEDRSHHGRGHYALTFDGLLSRTPFVEDMRKILQTLERAYAHPVDIEFAANFLPGGEYRIHLLQCRPLPVQGAQGVTLPTVQVGDADRIVQSRGAILGPSRILGIDRFVYVDPERYREVPLSRRYEVARLIGRINQTLRRDVDSTMLLGPGRWGTSSPELGVPVHFAEISHVSVLCEVVSMRENLVPDVSLGTHFLNELVETDILYMALFPHQQGNYLNEDFFRTAPNRLLDIVPSATRWQDVVRVVQTQDVVDRGGRTVLLLADAGEQEATIFVGDTGLLARPAIRRARG